MDENKYDLRETIHDIFKCLFYATCLSLVATLIIEVVIAVMSVPTEVVKQIKPILSYLEFALPFLYFAFKLGRDYGVRLKESLKVVTIKRRELVSLCCFDTGIVCTFLLVFMIIFMAALYAMPSLIEIIENTPLAEPILLAEIIAAVVLAPIMEEITIRGILLNIVKPHGTRFAIVFTSLIFALLHSDVGMIFAFFGGIILSHIALYYKSILPAILVHFLHNAFFYLPNALFVLLILLLPCCFFYFLYKGDYKKYFSQPMIVNAKGCWRCLLTPRNTILLVMLLFL